MVNTSRKRCSHDSCIKSPAWGALSDVAATACTDHKSDILRRPVINFSARCMVAGCRKVSRWGLDGEHPSHCRYHGPQKGGLVCTVGAARSEKNGRNSSYSAVKGPSCRVKAECAF
ncbi:unnamed protein product [Laminaria digitata]